MASSLAAQGGLRVLVSGAGIAGPTLAWFLARSGARVTVLERASELLAQGQNIDLRGTALNVVHQMGVLDAIRACNTTEKGTEFIDDRGRPFATFALGEGGGGALTTEYEILRGDLAHILYKAAESQPGVDFRFGTTIERVVENGESAVRVELSSGEEVEYDVLVLADGQWSKMRKQVFGTEGLEVVDKNCYVGYYTVPRTSEDGEMSCIHIAPAPVSSSRDRTITAPRAHRSALSPTTLPRRRRGSAQVAAATASCRWICSGASSATSDGRRPGSCERWTPQMTCTSRGSSRSAWPSGTRIGWCASEIRHTHLHR